MPRAVLFQPPHNKQAHVRRLLRGEGRTMPSDENHNAGALFTFLSEWLLAEKWRLSKAYSRAFLLRWRPLFSPVPADLLFQHVIETLYEFTRINTFTLRWQLSGRSKLIDEPRFMQKRVLFFLCIISEHVCRISASMERESVRGLLKKILWLIFKFFFYYLLFPSHYFNQAFSRYDKYECCCRD